MGAPMGHPFFGNQYTDGGYLLGSFTYEVLEKSADAVKTVVGEMGKGATKVAMNLATKQEPSKNFVLSAVDKISGKGLNKNHLIVAGSLTVVAIGGFLIYKFNKKSKAKKEGIQSIELNVGTCKKCDKPLIESTYIPGSEANNKESYIICKNCGEKNFANYSNCDDSSK